jgi:2'-5' RNA ligase
MSTRYAVYFAPPPESDLWRFGSRVLGRDAATGATIEGYAPAGFSPQAWREIAAEPRRYGFHATLKAPFHLREGRTLAELEAAIAALAAETPPFDLGVLRASALKPHGGDAGFVALTPPERTSALAALESQALHRLDAFRAPPSPAEIARRRPERLSERQREYLALWGYPYVLEEFRLHFTLTGAVPAPEALLAKLAEDFAREVADPRFAVDAVALFEQHEGEAFRLRRRFGLSERSVQLTLPEGAASPLAGEGWGEGSAS